MSAAPRKTTPDASAVAPGKQDRIADLEQALRETENRFLALAESTPQLVWVMDHNGKGLWANQLWQGFFGTTFHEAESRNWQEVIHPEDHVAGLSKWKHCLASGEPYEVEQRLRRADGEYRWHLIRARPVRDSAGRITAWCGTCTDIHEKQQLQQQLESANRAKDQFLAVLSHELRTPLTPVMMTLAAITAEPGLPPHIRDELEMIRRNIELETRLIDDLLDLSRIVSGKMALNPQPADLHVLLNGVLDIAQPELYKHRLNVSRDLRARQACINADTARIQQVLWNLVNNAIKFTPTGGSIRLRSYNSAADRIGLEIEDSGIGIEPQLLPDIFNAFEQQETDSCRQFGGLGLGLAISRAIMKMHGGSIRASSDGKGKGSRFTIELPALADVQQLVEQIEPALQDPAPPQAGRVLLVEDHQDTLRTMRRLLESFGYTVTTANTIAAARKLFDHDEFDLLISDLGLPDGSGIDLVQQLRQRQLHLPAIAISGYGMDRDIRNCLEAGFSAHLTKPLDLQRLQSEMTRLVGRSP